jgi:hypothetical protein
LIRSCRPVFNLANTTAHGHNPFSSNATNPAAAASQHLREFASLPDAWVVLARNMILVVGIYASG